MDRLGWTATKYDCEYHDGGMVKLNIEAHAKCAARHGGKK
jgi:hypothetical protein